MLVQLVLYCIQLFLNILQLFCWSLFFLEHGTNTHTHTLLMHTTIEQSDCHSAT